MTAARRNILPHQTTTLLMPDRMVVHADMPRLVRLLYLDLSNHNGCHPIPKLRSRSRRQYTSPKAINSVVDLMLSASRRLWTWYALAQASALTVVQSRSINAHQIASNPNDVILVHSILYKSKLMECALQIQSTLMCLALQIRRREGNHLTSILFPHPDSYSSPRFSFLLATSGLISKPFVLVPASF